MSDVLKICEQMVRVDRLIKSSRDAQVRAILREEYQKLKTQLSYYSKVEADKKPSEQFIRESRAMGACD